MRVRSGTGKIFKKPPRTTKKTSVCRECQPGLALQHKATVASPGAPRGPKGPISHSSKNLSTSLCTSFARFEELALPEAHTDPFRAAFRTDPSRPVPGIRREEGAVSVLDVDGLGELRLVGCPVRGALPVASPFGAGPSFLWVRDGSGN